jgi:class 3 adenylate cyclase/tetratricopeptide (TPR) repeat protein
VVCPSCGTENPAEARFCMSCGFAFTPPAASREQRKVVTVLFCDLVGSTALGEKTDPEALRAQLSTYFDDLSGIVERHGGTVEKFVGDAVMAVFGIPVAHEDDALRAVRAASEMRDAVVEHGLEARIGVNTGEVVTGGKGGTLVTGDAVNVAARLEQAAASGEILMGSETLALVRDAVRVEAVDPLTLKGKAKRVEAWRLVDVRSGADGLARHPDSPLVGRGRERERLWRDFEDAVSEPTCRLFTLLGPAGIGKSRLVADFLERAAGSADVLRGRCLHYGEGITYWPLVEMLIGAGIDSDSVLGSSPEDTRLAFRRLLEARAEERPQVVVLDDLHWAEPVFLDLVEHVADFSRDAPIFLLCVARTELLELRPGWAGGKLNATSILLEPLDGGECEILIGNLLGDSRLDQAAQERIAVASGGNPLFVEEMLAMMRESGDGDGEIVVPATIQALLQARLDRLGPEERVVVERGSVEGQVFHRGAVAELSPEVRPELEGHLATLVRKELIRPDRTAFEGDDAFRFRHLLIRDAAYEALPKAIRAELHEQFANWLAPHDLVERDEILGYHLEQASLYRAELNPGDPVVPELGSRASQHLATAGRSALNRGDYHAGRALLRRAQSILPVGDERRLGLAPDLFEALWESGDHEASRAVVGAALEASDPVLRATAAILYSTAGLFGGGQSDTERSERREEARQVLEQAGNDHGLGLYWWSVALEAWFACRAAETAVACEQALLHFERGGNAPLSGWARHRLFASHSFGPTPAREALERIETIRAEGHGELLDAWSMIFVGRVLAMDGKTELGRELVRDGRGALRDAGLLISAGGMSMAAGEVELRAGDLAAEERVLREGFEALEALGDRSYYPTVALTLAECLYRRGADDEEIERLCEAARSTTGADDLVNFVWLDMLGGLLHARRGEHEDAEECSRRAIALAETTDFYFVRGYALAFRAETLALAGRSEHAAVAAAQALEILEAKGDIACAERSRTRLASFGVTVV